MGLSVPGDLWVVGYDDVAMAGWERIDLTTIRQPNDEIARHAVQWLLERIAGDAQAARRHQLQCSLRVRGSTGRVPVPS